MVDAFAYKAKSVRLQIKASIAFREQIDPRTLTLALQVQIFDLYGQRKRLLLYPPSCPLRGTGTGKGKVQEDLDL